MAPFRCLAAVAGFLMLAGQAGCLVAIPTIPLNAPGYGHTYQVVDEEGKPIQAGVLLLESFYRDKTIPEMVGCYPVQDGEAQVPKVIGMRGGHNFAFGIFPVCVVFSNLENSYGTYIYPMAPGYTFNEGWQAEPWDKPEFLGWCSSPPKVLQMRRVPPDTERENLHCLARSDRMGIGDTVGPMEGTLREYVYTRLAELGPPNSTPMERAIASKDAGQVSRLLKKRSDPNLAESHTLMRPIHSAVIGRDPRIVNLLMFFGAQVNVFDAQGRTPLGLAEDEEIALMLLKRGADPNLGSKEGNAPIQTAVLEGREKIVDLMLVHGGKVDLKNGKGETLLTLAKSNGKTNIVAILREWGAKE
jgi:hypothetical protein